jgi:hypothetical protein
MEGPQYQLLLAVDGALLLGKRKRKKTAVFKAKLSHGGEM